jgi:hypothetical protein
MYRELLYSPRPGGRHLYAYTQDRSEYSATNNGTRMNVRVPERGRGDVLRLLAAAHKSRAAGWHFARRVVVGVAVVSGGSTAAKPQAQMVDELGH